MFDIMELHHKLTQNRLEANSTDENIFNSYKARIASRNKDIDLLLRRGSTPCQVSEILMVHPDIVESRVAELERDEEDRRRFMQTTRFPETGGYVAIFR